MGDSDDVEADPEPLLLLEEHLRAFHDHQDEVGDHDKERAVLGYDADALDEATALGREVAEADVYGCIGLIVLYDGLIDVCLHLYGHVVFGIGLFEVAHVGNPVEE